MFGYNVFKGGLFILLYTANIFTIRLFFLRVGLKLHSMMTNVEYDKAKLNTEIELKHSKKKFRGRC